MTNPSPRPGELSQEPAHDRSIMARFYRSPLSRFYNYHQYRLKTFISGIAASVRPNDVVLDVGAGDCQYKPFFAGRCKYISQDVGDKDACFTYDKIDIRSEIYSIPLPDASVDVILCTQVMEHLKYPTKAIQEMARLLKPGGRLCITVPFASDEHMLPYDYFRYTRFALEFLLMENGFEKPEIIPQGGRFILMGKMIKDLFPLLTNRPGLQKALWILQAPVVVPTLFLLYLLDPLDRKKHFTNNYDCIAKRR
ncbi:MAG: class I SAM-dependent methyltransferase [Verrucomicrobiota bacterium]